MRFDDEMTIFFQLGREEGQHLPKGTVSLIVIPSGRVEDRFPRLLFEKRFIKSLVFQPVLKAEISNSNCFGKHLFLMHEVDHSLAIDEGSFPLERLEEGAFPSFVGIAMGQP